MSDFQHPSCLITKEEIHTINFSNEDVLKDKKQKSVRAYCLNRAMQLGNLLKNKVNIYFRNDDDKLMRVQTTVWAVTTDAVILKQGILIPKSSVVSID